MESMDIYSKPLNFFLEMLLCIPAHAQGSFFKVPAVVGDILLDPDNRWIR